MGNRGSASCSLWMGWCNLNQFKVFFFFHLHHLLLLVHEHSVDLNFVSYIIPIHEKIISANLGGRNRYAIVLIQFSLEDRWHIQHLQHQHHQHRNIFGTDVNASGGFSEYVRYEICPI